MSETKIGEVRRIEGHPGTASLLIGRYYNCSDESRECYISIEDGASGCRVVELHMDAATLMRALTGAQVTVPVEWTALSRVGKVRELKTEAVSIPTKYRGGKGDRGSSGANFIARAILAPYETDGWHGSPGDLFNHHNQMPGEPESYAVSFVRWVERSTPQGEQAAGRTATS